MSEKIKATIPEGTKVIEQDPTKSYVFLVPLSVDRIAVDHILSTVDDLGIDGVVFRGRVTDLDSKALKELGLVKSIRIRKLSKGHYTHARSKGTHRG